MQKINAPSDAYTRTKVFDGKIIANIPRIIRTITETNRTPPIVVKSHLVWNAKIVKLRVTTAVMPTANKTSITSKFADITPIMND